MNRFVIALMACIAAVGGTVLPPAKAEEQEKVSLMTILAAGETQTQLMALTLTVQSMQKGATVRVLLCGPAGDLALKEPPAAATTPLKPAGVSPHGLVRKLIEAGVPIDVCAIYLPNKDLTADALIQGIGQARPDAMAGHLLAPDTRILSF